MKENEIEKNGASVVPTKREIFFANLKKKYPEREFADEDEYYAASMEGYDAEH